MKRPLLASAIVLLGASVSVTVGAERAAAQGPSGAGAAAAAQESSHSLNPLKWVKKDSKNSSDAPASRGDFERKLTPSLQAQGLLSANTTATDACAPFTTLEGCLAVLHASHTLGVDFVCLRAAVTGVHTSADVSGCKVADGEKPQGLTKVIHQLKPDANAKQAAKDADRQAVDDLTRAGG